MKIAKSYKIRPGFIPLIILTVLIELVLFYVPPFIKTIPNPKLLKEKSPSLTTRILERNGNLLYKIYKDEDRTYVRLEDISPYVIKATVSTEDESFYTHLGLSLKGILRSLKTNLSEGTLYGGSTITQQLVKNRLLTPDKTLTRKIKEIILAVWAERIYSKDEILEMYLNEVGYGGVAYGIEEASESYFNKHAKDLTLAEAALLAGLPSAPSDFTPFVDKNRAEQREKDILKKMFTEGKITSKEYIDAVNQKLVYAPTSQNIKAPHFVMYVRQLLEDKYGKQMVEQGGLAVTTSLDLGLQEKAEKILKEELSKIKWLNVTNGAILVTKPETGEILAMVGSEDYFDQENDGTFNVTLAQRQPGSSIKPLMYSLALQKGFTAATILYDTKIAFPQLGSTPYVPINYDGTFHGPVTLRMALGNSLNVPAVKTLNKIGVRNFVLWAGKLGITTWKNPDDYGLSLTLGGGDVRMVDMAVAYSTFANEGNKVNLNPILRIKNTDPDSKQVFSYNINRKENVLDSGIAFIISDILADNKARAMEFGLYSDLNIPGHRVSVKTGTSNNLRDNWTIGYNKDYLVAVWVGNNNNSPMSRVASGITGASSIWRRVMDLLLKNYKDTPTQIPNNVVRENICTLTGTLTCEGCPTKKEYFIKGTEPKTACKKERVEELLKPRK